MEEYRRWEDSIKMDLKEIGVSLMSWIDSAQDRDYLDNEGSVEADHVFRVRVCHRE